MNSILKLKIIGKVGWISEFDQVCGSKLIERSDHRFPFDLFVNDGYLRDDEAFWSRF